MAEAQPIKFGPFTGGMNTYSDQSAVTDSEATFIQNFDIDIDGSLASRPPITIRGSNASFTNAKFLALYRTTTADYLIFSNATGTYAYNLATSAITTITTTIQAAAAIQYNNKIWLVAPSGSANPGGSWDATSFVAVATMPKGNSCCIYKERMFIGVGASGASTVYFSSPADPGAAWGSADFFYVNKGDGEALNDIRVFNNVIVIFKESSTYIFAYDSAPTRGTVQLVSSTVGVQDRGCVVDYEDIMFVFHDNQVFQVQNWNFDPINIKVPFVYQNATPAAMAYPRSLSVLNDRLFCRYYEKTYVYNLKTRAWAEWVSEHTPTKFFADPNLPADGFRTFVSFSCYNNVDDIFQFRDGYVTGLTETMTHTVITKTHDLQIPYTFKRLMWWGLDGFAKVPLTAKVSPVSLNRPVTWEQVATKKWNELGTWGRLLDISIDVTDSAQFGSLTNSRSFTKFLKSLRFRQVYFTITATTTGIPADAPLRVYYLMAVTANKQLVNAKAN